MVYIKSADGTEKKFACIKCIKGHRSSKCTHDKRELIEIKRKGRPVSQCETCRLLRKTKQVHVKCVCEPKSKGTTVKNNTVLDHEHISKSTGSPPLNVNSINTTFSSFDNILASTSCLDCNRPKLYCNCPKPKTPSSITTSTTNSSEGSATPPIVSSPYMSSNSITLSYPAERFSTTSPTISAGLTNINTSTPNSNNNSLPSSPMRHLTIPIHDPSDDIDSDTPIYKSVEETPHLGEFANKSSDELMSQIYSGFPSSNSSIPSASSPLMREGVDDELVELSREP
ncbi:copper fist DNA binding domain-containing protein [Mucor lusitanicus]|uniref:Copper fist DNA binding domain-containing protein n=1 Tax=Mucor circinelloides f. lusitanicus TaxID=29924 RepID=A0A8H4BAU1_MUCCL|nr:copper fist DNA binding domain-containing protein [Mucor lusitanicus]